MPIAQRTFLIALVLVTVAFPASVTVCPTRTLARLAIGTASSLGAVVRATDPRPEVADQVKSLGGEYMAIESPEVEVSATGYAKEMGDDYKAREAKMYAEQTKDVDIIITTALIPGGSLCSDRPTCPLVTGPPRLSGVVTQSSDGHPFGSVVSPTVATQSDRDRGAAQEPDVRRQRMPASTKSSISPSSTAAVLPVSTSVRRSLTIW